MKRILTVFLLITSWLAAGSNIAVSVKAKGDVTRIDAESKAESPLKMGKGLVNEDVIRTGKDGFAVAMFLDDKTTIKIKENSEFLIGGTRSAEGIAKRVNLSYGTMAASVTKQKGEEFIIATPTSVASVKGTDIVVVSDPILGDIFITLVGTIVVTNNTTGESTEVNGGESANSTPEGGLDVDETNPDDVPDFTDPEGDEGETHELRFEIEDINGTLHEVIIQYQ